MFRGHVAWNRGEPRRAEVRNIAGRTAITHGTGQHANKATSMEKATFVLAGQELDVVRDDWGCLSHM